MKHDWEFKKLGEVCETTSGGTPAKSHPEYYEDGTIPWLKSGEIAQGLIYDTEEYITEIGLLKSSAKIVPVDSVVIAMYGATVGQCGIIKSRMCTNQAVCSIIPNKSIIPQFLRLFLISKKTDFIKTAVGGAQPNISQGIIKNTIIPVPPLAVQEQIVLELDKVSEIIEKKKQQVKELDNLAQSIFYDMFGDPVENDKGWEVKKLGNECLELRYGTSRPAVENGKYGYIRMGNLTISGHLNLSDLKRIDIPEGEIEKCLVRKRDVLFNRTNSLDLIGKTCMFDLDEPMVIAGYIIRVRLKPTLHPRYVVSFFNTGVMKKVLRKMAKGAVNQANINSKELSSILIPLPPLPLQQSFAQKIEGIEKQKELINQSIKEVQTLFDARMDYWFGEN